VTNRVTRKNENVTINFTLEDLNKSEKEVYSLIKANSRNKIFTEYIVLICKKYK